ncbi:peptidase C39 family protein [bacterium]|nr:MAG: peptidase C39 family protein [bacterium]
MTAIPLLAMAATFSPGFFAAEVDRAAPEVGKPVQIEYSDLPMEPFKEAIVSWNVEPAANASLRIEMRAKSVDSTTKWYRMADWAMDRSLSPRESLKGQKDGTGTVMTDTLAVNEPATAFDIRFVLTKLKEGPDPVLKFFSVSTSIGKATPGTGAPSGVVKTIDVPRRCQGNYPRGGSLCSPTSLSMVLWHYANVLSRPELNKDVPEVEANVWDAVYDGAGNWPFNTAYAGSFPGMRAYVARMKDLSDLERWIDAEYPVICSVSFDMLRGRPLSPEESGHLVVLVGFDEKGDPVFNDPAYKEPRKSYPRADFEKAWAYSNHTVYLVHPSDAKTPPVFTG